MKNIKSIVSELLLLSGPLILAQVAHISMQVVDTIMLGRLGPLALATGSIGGVIIYNVAVFFVGILSSTGSLLAQAQGANDKTASRQILTHSLLLAVVLSAVCMLIIISIPIMLPYFHLDDALIYSVRDFLRMLAWGIPPWMIYFVLRDFVAVYQKSKIILFISILSVPFNAILNYIFMYGQFGLPLYGVSGVGLATTVVRWSMLIGLVAYIFVIPELRAKFKLDLAIRWEMFAKICKLGIPSGLMMGLEIAMFSISGVIMGSFGIVALAAHHIAIQCANMVFTIPLGISQAVSIQIGRAVGSKETQYIAPMAYTAIAIGAFVAVVVAGLFYSYPYFITHLFLNVKTPDAASVLMFAATFLSMAAILQFLDTLQIITIGSLRGLNDTLMPMLYGIVAYWLFGLSSVYLFGFKFNWQGIGLWCGLCVGIGVSVTLLLLRFYSLSRKKLFSLE